MLKAVTLVALASCFGIAAQNKTYTSPDGKLIASIQDLGHQGCYQVESYIVIRSKSGETVYQKPCTKLANGSGYFIDTVSWSPDSQYLLYGGGNAGGHQLWHHPDYLFSRVTRTVYSLENLVGALGSALYPLQASDQVTFCYYDPDGGNKKVALPLAVLEKRAIPASVSIDQNDPTTITLVRANGHKELLYSVQQWSKMVDRYTVLGGSEEWRVQGARFLHAALSPNQRYLAFSFAGNLSRAGGILDQNDVSVTTAGFQGGIHWRPDSSEFLIESPLGETGLISLKRYSIRDAKLINLFSENPQDPNAKFMILTSADWDTNSEMITVTFEKRESGQSLGFEKWRFRGDGTFSQKL